MRPLLPILTAGAFAAATAASAAIPAGAAPGPPAQAVARQAVVPSEKAPAMRLPGGFKHLVVIYQENHSFDNLYGTLGYGPRRAGRRARKTPRRRTPCRSPRTARRTTACCRTTSTSTSPPAANTCQDPAARRRRKPRSSTSRSASTATSTPRTRPARRRAASLPTVCSKGSRRPAGWLHQGPRAPLLPGAVPAQRRAAEPLRRPARDAVGLTMGYYDTDGCPICAVPPLRRSARSTSWPTSSSRPPSAGRSSTTSG